MPHPGHHLQLPGATAGREQEHHPVQALSPQPNGPGRGPRLGAPGRYHRGPRGPDLVPPGHTTAEPPSPESLRARVASMPLPSPPTAWARSHPGETTPAPARATPRCPRPRPTDFSAASISSVISPEAGIRRGLPVGPSGNRVRAENRVAALDQRRRPQPQPEPTVAASSCRSIRISVTGLRSQSCAAPSIRCRCREPRLVSVSAACWRDRRPGCRPARPGMCRPVCSGRRSPCTDA